MTQFTIISLAKPFTSYRCSSISTLGKFKKWKENIESNNWTCIKTNTMAPQAFSRAAYKCITAMFYIQKMQYLNLGQNTGLIMSILECPQGLTIHFTFYFYFWCQIFSSMAIIKFTLVSALCLFKFMGVF